MTAPPTGASGGRDATAGLPAPSVPRSCGSRDGPESAGALALVAAATDGTPLRSGSEALDGTATLCACGGVGTLWVGGGSVAAASRGGGAGRGCAGGAIGSPGTDGATGVEGFRGSTAGEGTDRGRGTAAGGVGRGGGGMSAGSRSSHATRGACCGTNPAEPATTITPNPR